MVLGVLEQGLCQEICAVGTRQLGFFVTRLRVAGGCSKVSSALIDNHCAMGKGKKAKKKKKKDADTKIVDSFSRAMQYECSQERCFQVLSRDYEYEDNLRVKGGTEKN